MRSRVGFISTAGPLRDFLIIHLRILFGVDCPTSKISLCSAVKKKVDNYGEQETMHHGLECRMKSAQDDVVRYPNNQSPSRPVAGAEHKHRSHDRDESNQANQYQLILKWALNL
jgi:hypothetical protein